MGKKVKKLKASSSKIIAESNNDVLPLAHMSTATTGNPSDGQSASNNKKSPKSSETSHRYTAEQLLAKAEECVDSFNYDLAEKFCQRAVEAEPENVAALEQLGFLKTQIGDLEGARTVFNKVVSLQPDTGYSKYMQLGQISTGNEAIAYYTKGIDIMKQLLSTHEDSSNSQGAACADEKKELDVTVREISNAYCAIAELFLTDSCFEEDAETKCYRSITDGLEADNTNPEAYQVLASYWLCKNDKKAAGESIEKGLSLWLPQLRETHRLQNEEPSACTSQQPIFDPIITCPVSYSVRVSYAKTFIELENYEVAQDILGFLLLEDSQIVEVWYLLGWLNYLRGETCHSDARYHLTKAREVAIKTEFDDESMIDHINELLTELGPASASDLEDEGEDNIKSDSDSNEDQQSEEDMEH